MNPRAEFILASALLAALLQLAVFMALAVLWWNLDPASTFRRALTWLPSPLFAAGVSAWFTSRLHRRTLDRGGFKPFGLAWRTVLLAMLLYPACVAGWLLLTALADQRWAENPATLQQTWKIMPTLVMYPAIFAVLLGTAPALLFEYFVARRYLRRGAGKSKSAP